MPGIYKHKQFFSFVWRFLLTVILVIWLFAKFSPSHIYSILNQCPPFFFWSGFIGFTSLYFIGVLRWKILLKGLSVDCSYKQVFFPFFKGLFLNLFFPSVIAGDFYRTMTLKTEDSNVSEILASVIVDRLSGFLALALIATIGGLYSSLSINNPLLIKLLSLIVAGLILFTVVLFSHAVYIKVDRLFVNIEHFFHKRFPIKVDRIFQVRGVLERFHNALMLYRYQSNILIQAFIFSFIIQIAIPIIFYWLALGLGLKPSFILCLFIVPLINGLSLVPLTIAGIGIREWCSVELLPIAGINKEAALTIALVFSLVFFFTSLIGGILYVGTLCFGWVQHYLANSRTQE